MVHLMTRTPFADYGTRWTLELVGAGSMEVARARLAEEPDADVITIQYRINTRKQIAHAGFSLN